MKPTLILPLLLAALSNTSALGAATPSDQGTTPPSSAVTQLSEDPYLWLEEVTGPKALEWAKRQNTESTRELEAHPEFEPIRRRLLAILDSKEKIPLARMQGRYLYNFWRDENHVRGIWRRTTLNEYRKAEPQWELVLDLDGLAEAEKENWVWHGAQFLHPDYDRALLSLSRGGADAEVVREFDIVRKEFMSDGFSLPEAKSTLSWRNRDMLYVATDFGPGSLTSSGYPRIVKEWARSTPLNSAHVVFIAEVSDMAADAAVSHDRGYTYELIQRQITFYTSTVFVRRKDGWQKIDKPDDAKIDTFSDQILITLRSDWTVGGRTYPAGALLAANFEQYLEGKPDLTMLFEPAERKALSGVNGTKNGLFVNELENVRSQIFAWQRMDGRWIRSRMQTPDCGSVSVWGVDPDASDDYFLMAQDFLTPSTLYLGTITQPDRERLKNLPEFFKADDLEVSQLEARSKDGTKIPYFLVSPRGLKRDGSNPTLLYGYGGFQVPMEPNYLASVGPAWLERGGAYALANIRGGGEFGPAWHKAAVKENRQRAYDDFIAVAEDLIRQGVTSPRHLGIMGGSNGGLLMGVMLTQRPDLFGAIVCQVPLLDMKRYNRLLAGASWMGEYGNPSLPEEWVYLSKYSPYQNVVPDKEYPRVLFTTSTRDDRVHPGHARKMVAKMKAQGHDVLYYENIEGGHGGAANNQQRAYMQALAYTFLLHQLQK
jgi:prolyl oligopeptidase